MATTFVRHTVSNYKTWRKVYDDFAPVQKRRALGSSSRVDLTILRKGESCVSLEHRSRLLQTLTQRR